MHAEIPTLALERLKATGPQVGVELRPPRANLSGADSMDVWIDMYHAIQRLVRQGAMVYLTDNAVGQDEEENLAHLVANLGDDVDRARIVPFLTTKHSLDYCLLYAQRAVSYGFNALTVLGGDRSVGPARCVEHAYQLRRAIRERLPGLTLGGWANPHGDAVEQLDYLEADDFTAEFFLTQVVSHHSLDRVERFLNEAARRNVRLPGVFGVFYYRSANPRTLERLGDFFPVPAEGITGDFASGLSPEAICVKSIRALREIGAERVYVSNLGVNGAGRQYRRILSALAK